MLQTAEYVAKNYSISREQQDRYGVRSQQRAARRARRRQVQRRDRADDDDDEGRRQGDRRGVDARRSPSRRTKGIRADTTYEGVSKIKPAIEGGVIAAGNASQFSDGASVVRRDERPRGGEARG